MGIIDRMKKPMAEEIDKSIKKHFEQTSKNNQERLEKLLLDFHKDLKETVKIEVEKQLNEQRNNKLYN